MKYAHIVALVAGTICVSAFAKDTTSLIIAALPADNNYVVSSAADHQPQIISCVGSTICTKMWVEAKQTAIELAHAATWEEAPEQAIITPYSPLTNIRVVMYKVKTGRDTADLKFMCELKPVNHHIPPADHNVTICEQTMRHNIGSVKTLTVK